MKLILGVKIAGSVNANVTTELIIISVAKSS